MGRMPARFPANESALNLSRRESVAAFACLDLPSSLESTSNADSGGCGDADGAISSMTREPVASPAPSPPAMPRPISAEYTPGLRAAEEGFT